VKRAASVASTQPYFGIPNKSPFDAQRIVCRELMPLMASGTRRDGSPETQVQRYASTFDKIALEGKSTRI
jgi:hypothetical protein